MAYDRFLISNFNTGLQQDLKPWLIMDDAWEELNNVYAFRGRIVKRVGSQYMGDASLLNAQSAWTLSRFRVDLGPTVAGALAGTVPVFVSGQIGMAFSIGTELYYVFNTAPGPQNMSDTGTTATKTYDNTNGNFSFAGAPAGNVFFYPALPVMGLTQYQVGAINNEPTFGFDTSFAYQYSNGWTRSTTGTPPQWFGGQTNFFWTANWEDLINKDQILFVTNYNVVNPNGLGNLLDDPIWIYQGSTLGWRPYSYSPNATVNPTNIQPLTITRTKTVNPATPGDTITNYVQSARIIVAFYNRVLLIGTIENDNNEPGAMPVAITPANYVTSTNTQYVNRCRYSHNGSPLAANAWLEPNFIWDNAGNPVKADGAGYIDATTDEQAISAEFIKDRLIVYFERSTWEIVYTGSELQPFLWQRINTELGSQSQFSSVPFDTEILTIGQTGVHACSGANVQRIDSKIPDYIFTILENNIAPQRIWGKRDFQTELVYWTVPQQIQQSLMAYPFTQFPTQLLVYNYRNNSFALWDDCITAFGFYQQQTGSTWANSYFSWQEATWSWNYGAQQPAYRAVACGNPEGFTFIFNNERNRNAAVMQITKMVSSGVGRWTLTIMNHALFNDQFITIENANGITAPSVIYQVISVTDANTVVISGFDISGTYTGGGTSARVSQINMLSKQFNPYVGQDRNVHLYKINFQVLRSAVTFSGSITVDYLPSYGSLSIKNQAVPGVLTGTNTLDMYGYTALELTQERLWHPVYFATDGEAIQLNIYVSPAQMTSVNNAFIDFELHGMLLYTRPTTDRLS